MEDEKLKIMIVDDSRVTRDLIKHLLSINPHVEIVGVAENGVEAMEYINKNPPDIVLTDIVMPKMNGIELTKKIMETNPIPVIVMSGVYSSEEIRRSFDLIDAGAIAILEKPKGIADEHFADTAKFIFDTARLISSIRGFKKPVKEAPTDGRRKLPAAVQARIKEKGSPAGQIKAIAIGSSIGGPKALQALLSPLPPTIQAPIFIVQHISPGFVQGFAEWLDGAVDLKVAVAKNNEQALPGHVYIAPDKQHMIVDSNGMITLVDDVAQTSYVPSAGKMFQSIASSYGSNALGILLLGAEKDGAKGLQEMRGKGALTIAESSSHEKASAWQAEAAAAGIPIEEIAMVLPELVQAK